MRCSTASLIGYRIAEPIENSRVSYRRDLALFLAFGAAILIVLGGLPALRAKHTSLASQLKRAAGDGDAPRRPDLSGSRWRPG